MLHHAFDKPHVLLIDKNYDFAHELATAAHEVGLGLHHYESVMELAYMPFPLSYHAAIVTEDQEGLSMEDLLGYIKMTMGTVPVIVLRADVSAKARDLTGAGFEAIVRQLLRRKGAEAIMASIHQYIENREHPCILIGELPQGGGTQEKGALQDVS